MRTLAELVRLDPAALVTFEEQAQKGCRVLSVARSVGNEPLRLMGLVLLSDPPRPESYQDLTAG